MEAAIGLLLDAEGTATEQIRYHASSREIVRHALRMRSPSEVTMGLASRMKINEL
jgi:hypothetical protein